MHTRSAIGPGAGYHDSTCNITILLTPLVSSMALWGLNCKHSLHPMKTFKLHYWLT